MFSLKMFFAFACIICAIIILLFLLARYSASDAENKKDKRNKKGSAEHSSVQCPLCNSFLLKGEDLYTRVYRPMNVSDQLCTINGCPHCYPVLQAGVKRECPVCHKMVPIKDGHLTARLFNKTDGKKHVIVTGCSECCKH